MLRLFEQQVDGGSATGRGPSGEMRRFSAGIRVVTALMCTVMLLANEERIGPWPTLILGLYCAWSALAFIDLARTNGEKARTWRWSLAILLLPVVGAAAYLVFGSSQTARRTGVAFVGGGLAVMAAAFAITLVRIS